MIQVYLIITAWLLVTVLAIPQATAQNPYHVTINFSLPFAPNVDTTKFMASSNWTSYGRPLITRDDPQWPQWAFRYSEKLYNEPKLKRDEWAWMFADIGIAGIYIPKRYSASLAIYAQESFGIFQGLSRIGRNQVSEIARLGYNLQRLPSEPWIENSATLFNVSYYPTSDSGAAIDNTQPSFVMMGYPMSTALCYRYYGKPVSNAYRGDICKDQDEFVKADTNGTWINSPSPTLSATRAPAATQFASS